MRPRGADAVTAAEPTISVDLTAGELHVLTCAMAGNFPPRLRPVRLPTLRKLAKATRTLTEAGVALVYVDEMFGRAGDTAKGER